MERKLNSNELQIGDWVKYYDCNLKKECYSQVTSIKTDSTEKFVQTSDSDVYYRDKVYKPIPLTTEILELNGFYLHNFGINTEMYYYAFPKECGIPVERGFGIHEQNEVFFITDHCLMLIKFVHELQRALRCCELWNLANNFRVN